MKPIEEAELTRLTSLVSEVRRYPRDYVAKSEFGISFNLDMADKLLREIDRLKVALEPIALIDALRADEGDSITILCDNPDFNGQPNCAVECQGIWTDFKDRRFTGDTLTAALFAAYEALPADRKRETKMKLGEPSR